MVPEDMTRLILIIAVCFSLLACAVYADSTTNRSEDFVAFFKQAISSPPDIEHFTACQRILRKIPLPPKLAFLDKSPSNPPPQCFEGGRSDKNYFFSFVSYTNGIKMVTMTGGRSGSNAYQINPNTLTFTTESTQSNPKNYVAANGDGFFGSVEQFLNMGLADVKSESVVWQGNEFNALRDHANIVYGPSVYGRLESSNGLPCSLSVSAKKGDSPYILISYAYPSPPTSLGGFPERIIISSQFEDGLHPWSELTLSDVQVAKQPLPEKYFAASNFMTSNIKYVDVYSNNTLYSVQPNGRISKIPPPVPNGMVIDNSPPAHPALVIASMGIISAVFAMFLYFTRRKSNKQ